MITTIVKAISELPVQVLGSYSTYYLVDILKLLKINYVESKDNVDHLIEGHLYTTYNKEESPVLSIDMVALVRLVEDYADSITDIQKFVNELLGVQNRVITSHDITSVNAYLASRQVNQGLKSIKFI